MASALDRDCVALSKAEVLPGTVLAVPVPALPSSLAPVCSLIVAIASTVASAFEVMVAPRSAETATLPAVTLVVALAVLLIAAVTPPLISLRTTMPPAERPPEPVALAGTASLSPTRRQRSRSENLAVLRSSLFASVRSAPI